MYSLFMFNFEQNLVCETQSKFCVRENLYFDMQALIV